MRKMGRTMALAIVCGMALCVSAVAHEENTPGEAATLQAEISALRTDVSSVQNELKALRNDMRKILAELKGLKATQKKPERRKRQPDTTIYDVKVGSSPIRGPQDAPVTIVEFADLQCPFCIRETPKLLKVLEEYPDKVRLVFKHFPLSFHKQAKPAHAATEFARLEGGNEAFWKMHDMIVQKPKALDVAALRGYVETLGLDLAKFDSLMADQGKMDEMLKADMDEARKCKVRGTPTVLVNGLKLADRNISGYKARIDEILKGPAKKADEKK